MAEKRKPCLILMLRSPGKRKFNKVELFRGDQWEGFDEEHDFPLGIPRRRLYRLRINGKWNDLQEKGNIKWFTKWKFRDLLFRSLKI
jgi:hypothetical protein